VASTGLIQQAVFCYWTMVCVFGLIQKHTKKIKWLYKLNLMSLPLH